MAYSFQSYDPARMARASAKDAAVSFKKSVEVSKKLRGMMSDKADAYLEQVIELKAAVPFTRFVNGAGHRRGKMGPGKYPVKVAQQFLALIRVCVANAEAKGLGTPLQIVHVMAQPAATPSHHGRARGHAMKRAHLELVLMETEESKRAEKKQKKAKESVAAPKAVPTETHTHAAPAHKAEHEHVTEEKSEHPKADAPKKAAPKKAAAESAGEKKPAKPKAPKPAQGAE